jgi:hypothetical protein
MKNAVNIAFILILHFPCVWSELNGKTLQLFGERCFRREHTTRWVQTRVEK